MSCFYELYPNKKFVHENFLVLQKIQENMHIKIICI